MGGMVLGGFSLLFCNYRSTVCSSFLREQMPGCIVMIIIHVVVMGTKKPANIDEPVLLLALSIDDTMTTAESHARFPRNIITVRCGYVDHVVRLCGCQVSVPGRALLVFRRVACRLGKARRISRSGRRPPSSPGVGRRSPRRIYSSPHSADLGFTRPGKSSCGHSSDSTAPPPPPPLPSSPPSLSLSPTSLLFLHTSLSSCCSHQ